MIPERDVQVFGGKTRYRVVRADVADSRSWLDKGKHCQLLQQLREQPQFVLQLRQHYQALLRVAFGPV